MQFGATPQVRRGKEGKRRPNEQVGQRALCLPPHWEQERHDPQHVLANQVRPHLAKVGEAVLCQRLGSLVHQTLLGSELHGHVDLGLGWEDEKLLAVDLLGLGVADHHLHRRKHVDDYINA
jgi:hypothetical protein